MNNDGEVKNINKEYAHELEQFMNELQPSDMLTHILEPSYEFVTYQKVKKFPSKLSVSLVLTPDLDMEESIPCDIRVILIYPWLIKCLVDEGRCIYIRKYVDI
jgi:hypothetical protein